MISAINALQRLKEGNGRYLANTPAYDPISNTVRRSQLVNGQSPFAIILGCADSRVPAELIFDQGLGDLFVIRVAGNIVTPSLLGSVEYAVTHLNSRLVVVLGHTQCGAVSAAIKQLEQPTAELSPNLATIVDFISPSVSELRETDLKNNPDALYQHAIRANICTSVKQLQHDSKIIDQQVNNDDLHIVGAEYALDSGKVDFFFNVPPLEA